MKLQLQFNKSDYRKVGKALTLLNELEGSLTEPTNILAPEFTIVSNQLGTSSKCNYITVPEFGRSYFVTDWNSVAKDLIKVTCSIDIRESYKDWIKSKNAVVARQENEDAYNLYLPDSAFKVDSRRVFQTKTFPNGFDTVNGNYILAVSGNNA